VIRQDPGAEKEALHWSNYMTRDPKNWIRWCCGVTGLSGYCNSTVRQLADPTGVNLVVVFFQIIRVLIHISRIVRFNRLIRIMARGTTARARQLTLKCRIVSIRGVVLDIPSLLGSFCLLTAAPHGVTPFCTWTGGGHLGYR